MKGRGLQGFLAGKVVTRASGEVRKQEKAPRCKSGAREGRGTDRESLKVMQKYLEGSSIKKKKRIDFMGAALQIQIGRRENFLASARQPNLPGRIQ